MSNIPLPTVLLSRYFNHLKTLMLEGGADLRSTQTLLGHEQLYATQIYTHVSIKPLRAAHSRTHPGAHERLPKSEN